MHENMELLQRLQVTGPSSSQALPVALSAPLRTAEHPQRAAGRQGCGGSMGVGYILGSAVA